MNTFGVDEGVRPFKRPRVKDELPTASFKPPSGWRCATCLADVDLLSDKCNYCHSRLSGNLIPPSSSTVTRNIMPPPPPPPMKKKRSAPFEPPMKNKRSAGPAPGATTGGVKPPTKEDEAVDALLELATSCVNVSGSPPSDTDSDDDSTITIVEDLPEEAGVTLEDNDDDDDNKDVVNVGPGGYGIPPPMEKTTGPAPAAPTGDIPNPNPGLAAGPTPRAARIAFFRVGPLPTEVVPGSINSPAPSGGAGIGSAPIDTSATPSTTTTTTTTTAEPPPAEKTDKCLDCGKEGTGDGWKYCIGDVKEAAEAEALETGCTDPVEKALTDLDKCVASQLQGRWGGCTRQESRRLATATEKANDALHDITFGIAVKHQLLLCPRCAARELKESPTYTDGNGLSFWERRR
ncbi:hypothetical protein [uncultured Microbacterium sp.]|uniref:hypothetical protein n=1 Tax=uncultured Microbacterium sp. TaxID=191216 RepID=UPI0032B26390